MGFPEKSKELLSHKWQKILVGKQLMFMALNEYGSLDRN